MTELTRVFVPFGDVIKTTVKTEDGIERPARIVKGPMTDETLDLDKQIVDYDWAKKAGGEWFSKWANIREQHSSKAVGKGKELELDDKLRQAVLASKVVDGDAVVKIDEGILQGFSVGIKGARVVKDAGAPNGRIVGGQIVEVSIVDHPANESCKFVVAKAAKTGGVEKSEAVEFIDQDDDEILDKVADTDADKLADTDAEKAPAQLEGEEAVHNDAIGRARQAFRDLISQEAAEADFEPDDISWLASIASSLEYWVADEAFEQELDSMGLEPTYEILVDLAAIPDRAKRLEMMRGENRKKIDEALAKVREKFAAKSAQPAVAADPKPEKAAEVESVETPAEEDLQAEKVVEPDTEKFLTAESLKAALPDQLKAVLPEFLKEHPDVLAEALVGKFAGKDLEETVERLGKRAQPGGPVVNEALRTIEKTHPVNDVLEPGEVPAAALQEMAKYVELSKSDDVALSQSAERMLTKLKAQYGLVPA